MGRKSLFIKKQEQQICNEYFSEEKPGTPILAKRWNCNCLTIRNVIIRNGYILRALGETIKGGCLSEETKKKISIALKNRIPWNKRIPCFEETKQKIRKSRLKRKEILGFINSEETKRKMSISHKGQIAWNKNIPCSEATKQKMRKPKSEETKQKMREKALLRIQNNPGPFINTKPELKMKEILNDLNIPFKHQFRLGNHLYDFHILNTNILIEVDGDYYHGNPKMFEKLSKMQLYQKQRDIRNEKLAKENNFVLLRFWEDDILNNTEVVKENICKGYKICLGI